MSPKCPCFLVLSALSFLAISPIASAKTLRNNLRGYDSSVFASSSDLGARDLKKVKNTFNKIKQKRPQASSGGGGGGEAGKSGGNNGLGRTKDTFEEIADRLFKKGTEPDEYGNPPPDRIGEVAQDYKKDKNKLKEREAAEPEISAREESEADAIEALLEEEEDIFGVDMLEEPDLFGYPEDEIAKDEGGMEAKPDWKKEKGKAEDSVTLIPEAQVVTDLSDETADEVEGRPEEKRENAKEEVDYIIEVLDDTILEREELILADEDPLKDAVYKDSDVSEDIESDLDVNPNEEFERQEEELLATFRVDDRGEEKEDDNEKENMMAKARHPHKAF